MKNKQVKQMLKSCVLARREDAVVTSLLAGGGVAVGRKPALSCWLGTESYQARTRFLGWGRHVRVSVLSNEHGVVKFAGEDGKFYAVPHAQLRGRIECGAKRPETGGLAIMARNAM